MIRKSLAKVAALGMLTISLVGCGGTAPAGSAVSVPDGWPSSGLAEMIPVPSGEVTSVDIDDESFGAEVTCSIDEFNDYVDACKDSGYTVDAQRESNSYDAYSEEGYLISIHYWDYNENMDIDLNAPIQMAEISWPTIGAGSLVPAPASKQGLISSDSATFFYAYVGETDPDAFNDYVDACIADGYTVDYRRGDASYYADNAQGVHITINYVGFNTMTVRVDSSGQTADVQDEKAADTAGSTASAAEASATAEADSSSNVSTDFKATMDSYEAFFDKYVEFMKAYTADPTSTDLMSQYADMLAQYTDTMNNLGSIDTSSLSASDYAYYVEVSARITEKLATIGS